MPVHAVAAMQSPTLLNILATSTAWALKAYAMGDHNGLAEAVELRVPLWDGRCDTTPEVVLVCAPSHRDKARRLWPKAKLLWVIHNGYEPNLLPPEHVAGLAGVVCFSERVRWIRQATCGVPCHFISPAYEARGGWTWTPNTLWTLRNRPQSRHDDRECVFAAVAQGTQHAFYGQEQSGGYADAAKRRRLLASSSAYVSCLMRTSGFGLAEHEAFAAGVPVVGGWWGDLVGEMSPDYWTLVHDLYDMATLSQRLEQSGDGAEELSAMGLDYIRRCRTQERMDASITELLRHVG